MNWHIWKCSGIVCSCSTERGIRERENEMSGIVIEKVRKSFDTKDGVVEALKDVNLNIDSGDIYGIIGMSGAGKSTLVRCMNFLEVPTEGQKKSHFTCPHGSTISLFFKQELLDFKWR